MGQKINPSRSSPRHQPHLGLALVRRTPGEYGQASCMKTSRSVRSSMKELKQAGISKVVIERPHKKCRVTIHSARPGLIIGKKGADIDKLRKKAVMQR